MSSRNMQEHELTRLLENNRQWAATITAREPQFFARLAEQQAPEYLWIGCADSRVPANEIVGLMPGEMFVHRNVANVVGHTDLNCLAVIQYAVEALKVKHIIVCGHYGCGGVKAALHDSKLGLIDNWLRHVQDVREKYVAHLTTLADETEQLNRLCELNVIEQTINVCQTTILQGAWAHEQEVTVHGWIYGLHDGRLRDLNISIAGPEELHTRYQHIRAGIYASAM
jgi:carbonic anhydrase